MSATPVPEKTSVRLRAGEPPTAADVVQETVNPLVKELAAAQGNLRAATEELTATKATLAAALAEVVRFKGPLGKTCPTCSVELCPNGHPKALTMPVTGKLGLDRMCGTCGLKWASTKR